MGCVCAVLKPFPIAKKWAMRVTDEFFLQGDKERAQKMPTTPMCDRNYLRVRVPACCGSACWCVGAHAQAHG